MKKLQILLALVICFLAAAEGFTLETVETIYCNGAYASSKMVGKRRRFILHRQGKEKKAFDGHAVYPINIEIRKGKRYQIRFKAVSNCPMQIATALKQRPRPCSFVGLPAETRVSYQTTTTEKTYDYSVLATSSFAAGECGFYIYFGANSPGSVLDIQDFEYSEATDPLPLNLGPVANFSFYDEVENDGKGGWSDQGPNNCFANFPVGKLTLSGIPFQVIDPKQNNGCAILSFHCPKVKTNLRETDIILPLEKRRYLYLLHTATWVSPRKEVAGTLTFEGNVASVSRPVTIQVELGNWWKPVDFPNGKVVCEQQTNVGMVGAYLSQYEIPEGTSRIRFQTSEVCNWIVIAATMADQTMTGAIASPLKITANKEWRPIPLKPYVVKGTALDLADHRQPAGTFGRIIARKDGTIAFSKKPDQPVRLNGYNFIPHRIFQYPDNLSKLPKEKWQQALREYADAIAANGFNVIRWHFLDYTLIMGKHLNLAPVPVTPEDVPLKPQMTDMFFYLFHLLKERGIYAMIDMGTSQAGWTAGYPFPKNSKESPRIANSYFRNAMLYDTELRANWKAGATRLLSIVNPYTGMALKDDPAVAAITFFNEQFFLWTPQHCEALNNDWQAWMQKRSKITKTFPKLNKLLAFSKDPIGLEMSEFIAQKESDLIDFYARTVRACGYTGLINHFDNNFTLNRIPAMEKLSVIAAHPYIAHPVRLGKKVLIEQSSSISEYPGMGVTCAFLGIPFFITEYNHVMWNQFRHEGTIRGATVAALQNDSGFIMHEMGVYTKIRPMEPFVAAYDPIWRGNNVLSYFIFLRHDVAANTAQIAYYATDEDIRRHGQEGVNYGLSLLGWFGRVGVLYEHSKPISNISPDLAISPITGAIRKVGQKTNKPESVMSKENLISVLRDKKIISADNRTDSAKGIYQSATNEVLIDTRRREMSVLTPRLEMQVVKQNKTIQLNSLTIRSASIPAGIAVVSLDKKSKISDSGKVLFVVLTDALNSEMEFASQKRVEQIAKGKLPVLLRCGKFELELKSNIASPILYALNCSGERLEPIPVTTKHGRVSFMIDTTVLKEPAVFFELTQKK